MKFLYEYRTPDNAKHSGVVCASDRDAAYAELKARGVKPSRLVEAPGFFNKLFGKGKRWIAISVLGALCLALGAVAYTQGTRRTAQGMTDAIFDSQLRRQVIGDAAIIDEGIRTGWASVFASEGERFLASFAIPGVPAAIRSTTEEEVRKALDPAHRAQDAKLQAPSTRLEERQIRAMVEGMKAELREFLSDGGTIKLYGKRLVSRQEEEISYYQRAKNELENAVRAGSDEVELSRILERHNSALRKMGIRLLVMPEE